MTTPCFDTIAAIIPALDEELSIGAVISALQAHGIKHIIVADNGSRDATAAVARAAGAVVTFAPQRGYGAACLAALAVVPPTMHAVLFCDADGADDLSKLTTIVTPVLNNDADLVIGSRVLGQAAVGALTPPQRMGNFVAATLMRLLYRVRVTDLGPFRCISRAALTRVNMRDTAFGWTAEMQVKAFRLQLRVQEIPVDAKVRTAGESKISGRFLPIFKAGWAIISTILYYWWMPLGEPQKSTQEQHALEPITSTQLPSVHNTQQDVETCGSCTSDPVSGKYT